MNRRGAGVSFCFIAAAIYISNLPGGWSHDIFVNGLAYVGGSLTALSVISLIAGMVYLFFAEVKKEG